MIFAGPRAWIERSRQAARWLLWIAPVAAAIGSACALFLWSLDAATRARFQHPWLLFLLPFTGLAVGAVYQKFGRSAEGGNNLIVEQIHEPGGGVPRRMAPLILVSTVVTHLCGGSAGREGTAVQMGGSIASAFGRLAGLDARSVRTLLLAGVAAGFGAVFGTPLAGAVFALEVVSVGRMHYDALLPCLAAAVLGDWTCHLWGIDHTQYRLTFMQEVSVPTHGFHLDALLLAKVAAAAVVFGLASALFSETVHFLQAAFKKLCPQGWLRPAIGGMLVIALTYLVGTREYLGLGIWSPNPHDTTIPSLFRADHIRYWAWGWKLVFTAATLAAGFKGGEVTPLFFIGAALGNALSVPLGAPTDLFAALGFVAIFAGAANTPLACTLMGIELFGAGQSVYLATACFLAYLSSGHSGIYLSQRVAVPKIFSADHPPDAPLRQLRTSPFRKSNDDAPGKPLS